MKSFETTLAKVKDFYKRIQNISKEVYYYFFRAQVTMSNSRLNMCATCPLKYEFYYEKGLKGFPSAPLHFGSAVHAALKEFHSKYDLEGKEGTLEDLVNEFYKVWDELKEEMLLQVSGPAANRWRVELAEAGNTEEEIETVMKKLKTIYLDPEDELNSKKGGVRMLKNYFKDNQTNPNKIIALEKPLTLTIKGLDILAFIDRIEITPDGEIEIVDYKTGQRTKDKEVLDLGGDTQALIYTMMVEQKWKKKLRNFYYYYLSNRTKVSCNPPERLKNKIFDDLINAAQTFCV